jgi:hypothetical protein
VGRINGQFKKKIMTFEYKSFVAYRDIFSEVGKTASALQVCAVK